MGKFNSNLGKKAEFKFRGQKYVLTRTCVCGKNTTKCGKKSFTETRKLSEELRMKIINKYVIGKGYKTISKQLSVAVIKVTNII